MIKLFAKLSQKHNVDMKQFCEECPEYLPAVCSLLESNDLSVKCESIVQPGDAIVMSVIVSTKVKLLLKLQLSKILLKLAPGAKKDHTFRFHT